MGPHRPHEPLEDAKLPSRETTTALTIERAPPIQGLLEAADAAHVQREIVEHLLVGLCVRPVDALELPAGARIGWVLRGAHSDKPGGMMATACSCIELTDRIRHRRHGTLVLGGRRVIFRGKIRTVLACTHHHQERCTSSQFCNPWML